MAVKTAAIAIVGMACRYPDVRSSQELWENVLAQRRAFRRMPAERLRLEDYLSADRSVPDSLYSGQVAVIEGWEFDRVRYRVAGSTYRAADLAHWLALDVATTALADAGFAGGDGLPRNTCGVIVGNTLTGEFSRANVLRLRWPYVRRVIESGLKHEGIPADRRRRLMERLEATYKEPFPPIGEESLAGGLSNTIAGRICNHFDLKGGGYTVDGACSASLLAVTTACQSLETGDLDVALAGGVDLSLDPFELVGFAKAGALAAEEMRVYDLRSEGFWPGEGCGFVVLMRHEQAIAEERPVYAVIRGWGVSSDGSGGITRPEVDGQILALRRAYRRAGYGIETVGYFEGHGTGTAVGDATELEVIGRARREASPGAPPAAIGSIKANFGHTKAAAGIAGLLKATLVLHRGILPPTTGCEQPHAALTGDAPALRVLANGESWPIDTPMRASVSAMGFGGINTHLTLEGIETRRTAIAPAERTALDSWQDAEIFLFGADSAETLAAQLRHLLGYAARISRAELADVAAALARRLAPAPLRASVVAARPAELAERLERLVSWLDQGVRDRLDPDAGIFLGSSARAPRIGFLFSGQAAPVYLAGGALGRRFAAVRERYAHAGLPRSGDIVATAVAQPAIVTASLAGLEVMERLGLGAEVAIGHSLGEITALCWSGVIDPAAAIRIAQARGKAMMETPGPPSGMMSISAPARDVAELLVGTSAVIAGLNLPDQTVIAGENSAIEAVATRARARRWRAQRLPVSHAFHSPLMAPAAPALAAQLAREVFNPGDRLVLSTITGQPHDSDAPLRTLLLHQLTSPVRFMDAMSGCADLDLLIEVGPGAVLTSLARQLVGVPVIPLDAGGSSLRGLLDSFGAAFALGAPVKATALFDDRFTRPFDLDWKPSFFMNPCERAPLPENEPEIGGFEAEASFDDAGESRMLAPASNGATAGALEHAGAAAIANGTAVAASGNGTSADAPNVLDLIRRLVADRAELPIAAITAESRLLDDLHLNSISVAQIAAGAAKTLGLVPSIAPTDFADATVAQVALALEARLRTEDGGASAAVDSLPAGAGAWIRTFTVELIDRPAPRLAATGTIGSWRIFAPADYPLRDALAARFLDTPGHGVVLCLPPHPDDRHVASLLEAARAALLGTGDRRFVMVQHGGGAAGFARTLHLEAPEIVTLVVDVPLAHPGAVEWIASEAAWASGYAEIHYDDDGRRRVPVLKPLELPPDPGPVPLAPEDVLLVTGGGKGIAAECAIALARETGCRLALLGRSDSATDVELEANLARMRDAGVTYDYIMADVSDGEAVRSGIERVEQTLGPVNAILCGAGINEPQLIRSLDEQAFMRTMSAKVQGAVNVLGSVDLRRLKLFVAFGSIIARTGMRGEADYALANEWLTRLTERLPEQCPSARCLSIEWSVWSGVGMGERLGRIDSLMQMGVTPISPDEGIAILKRLLATPMAHASVVVTGRFGELPTLAVEETELPLLRFLERPRVHFPGIELVADSAISTATDPYLDDHQFGGERLLPAVMGLEAMAQAAMAVTGRDAIPEFEDVHFERPIVIGATTPTIVRVAALVRDAERVDVVVRCGETDFQVDYFRATCRFAPAKAGTLHANGAPVTATRVDLDPERDLYGGILFHRGRFRRLSGYRLLRAKECIAEIAPADAGSNVATPDWFGGYLPQRLVLGDAAARDTVIHSIQACIPHATLLPIGVERLAIESVQIEGERTVAARERSRDGNTLVYDVTVTDAEGVVVERWEGLALRLVGPTSRNGSWPATLIVPLVERRIAELVPGAEISLALERGGNDRRARSDAALRTVTDEAVVRRRPDGKPEREGNRSISAAHAGDLTLAVGGVGAVACDLEPIVHRERAVWGDLLGERTKLAALVAEETAEEYDASATRVWTATECLKKSGAQTGAPLTMRTATRDGWVVFASGTLIVATWTTEITGIEGRLVLAVLAEARTPSCEPTNTATSSASKKPTSSATSTTSTT